MGIDARRGQTDQNGGVWASKSLQKIFLIKVGSVSLPNGGKTTDPHEVDSFRFRFSVSLLTLHENSSKTEADQTATAGATTNTHSSCRQSTPGLKVPITESIAIKSLIWLGSLRREPRTRQRAPWRDGWVSFHLRRHANRPGLQ